MKDPYSLGTDAPYPFDTLNYIDVEKCLVGLFPSEFATEADVALHNDMISVLTVKRKSHIKKQNGYFLKIASERFMKVEPFYYKLHYQNPESEHFGKVLRTDDLMLKLVKNFDARVHMLTDGRTSSAKIAVEEGSIEYN